MGWKPFKKPFGGSSSVVHQLISKPIATVVNGIGGVFGNPGLSQDITQGTTDKWIKPEDKDTVEKLAVMLASSGAIPGINSLSSALGQYWNISPTLANALVGGLQGGMDNGGTKNALLGALLGGYGNKINDAVSELTGGNHQLAAGLIGAGTSALQGSNPLLGGLSAYGEYKAPTTQDTVVNKTVKGPEYQTEYGQYLPDNQASSVLSGQGISDFTQGIPLNGNSGTSLYTPLVKSQGLDLSGVGMGTYLSGEGVKDFTPLVKNYTPLDKNFNTTNTTSMPAKFDLTKMGQLDWKKMLPQVALGGVTGGAGGALAAMGGQLMGNDISTGNGTTMQGFTTGNNYVDAALKGYLESKGVGGSGQMGALGGLAQYGINQTDLGAKDPRIGNAIAEAAQAQGLGQSPLLGGVMGAMSNKAGNSGMFNQYGRLSSPLTGLMLAQRGVSNREAKTAQDVLAGTGSTGTGEVSPVTGTGGSPGYLGSTGNELLDSLLSKAALDYQNQRELAVHDMQSQYQRRNIGQSPLSQVLMGNTLKDMDTAALAQRQGLALEVYNALQNGSNISNQQAMAQWQANQNSAASNEAQRQQLAALLAQLAGTYYTSKNTNNDYKNLLNTIQAGK